MIDRDSALVHDAQIENQQLFQALSLPPLLSLPWVSRRGLSKRVCRVCLLNSISRHFLAFL